MNIINVGEWLVMCEKISMKKCSKCGEEKPATKEYFDGDKSRKDGLCYVCKECKKPEKERYRNVPEGHKRCRQCKKVLILDNFNKNKKSFDGIMNICVSCQKENNNIDYIDENKRCIKCERLLPANEEYFLKDKLCLDGFRNVCKECAGGSFGYRPRQEWTKEEDSILMENYPFMSNKELIEKYFPNRKESNITDHAIKVLGLHKDEEYIKYRAWSKEQMEILKKNYASKSNKELSLLVKKDNSLLIAKAIDLGISKDFWWSEDEDRLLKEKFPYTKTEELVNYFPNRNYNSIISRVQKLGLKKDKEYLYKMQCETGLKNLELVPDMKGENSPRWVERIIVNCDQCGREMEIRPSDLNNQEHCFCSRECAGKWRSENYCGENNPCFGRGNELWTEEMRKNQAIKAVKRLQKMNFSSKPTEPQIKINDLLDKLNINYDNEFDCKYYLIDNYLTDNNLMIEVQGNFFHCNPTMNLLNSRKSKIIGKDKSKHTYIKKYYGVEILYLWEKDIKENIKLCEELIKYYINMNGKLDNYHSFNYYINSKEELCLIDNLYCIGY
jgi:hypothetical protein